MSHIQHPHESKRQTDIYVKIREMKVCDNPLMYVVSSLSIFWCGVYYGVVQHVQSKVGPVALSYLDVGLIRLGVVSRLLMHLFRTDFARHSEGAASKAPGFPNRQTVFMARSVVLRSAAVNWIFIDARSRHAQALISIPRTRPGKQRGRQGWQREWNRKRQQSCELDGEGTGCAWFSLLQLRFL